MRAAKPKSKAIQHAVEMELTDAVIEIKRSYNATNLHVIEALIAVASQFSVEYMLEQEQSTTPQRRKLK